jgi:hypothetical protein
VSERPAATELLRTEGALLTRSHLRELGLSDRAIARLFASCGVVAFPRVRRVYIPVEEALARLEDETTAR